MIKLSLLILSSIFGSYYGGLESYVTKEVSIEADMPAEIVRTSVPLKAREERTEISEQRLEIQEEPVLEVEEKEVSEVKEEIIPELPKIRGEDDPRAIKSLFNKNYDGSNFKIVEELERTDFSRNYSVSYDGDGLTLSGTLHVPYNQGKGPFPLIVLNRGFYPTIVYSNGFGFSFEQDYFARRGYAALHLDFRGYGFSENREDYIRGRGLNYYNYTVDMINAIEAIKKAELPSVNTNKIGLFGLSMGGGIITTSLVAQPDIADAAVVWGPVSSDYYDTYAKWEHRRLDDTEKAELASVFGPLNSRESFQALSARPYLDRIKAPIEIHQGLEDKDTPTQWSERTVEVLDKLGKDFTYRQYPGEPHIFIGRSWSRAIANALDHFDTHLQPDDFTRSSE